MTITNCAIWFDDVLNAAIPTIETTFWNVWFIFTDQVSNFVNVTFWKKVQFLKTIIPNLTIFIVPELVGPISFVIDLRFGLVLDIVDVENELLRMMPLEFRSLLKLFWSWLEILVAIKTIKVITQNSKIIRTKARIISIFMLCYQNDKSRSCLRNVKVQLLLYNECGYLPTYMLSFYFFYWSFANHIYS